VPYALLLVKNNKARNKRERPERQGALIRWLMQISFQGTLFFSTSTLKLVAAAVALSRFQWHPTIHMSQKLWLSLTPT
jgi:hypothetical protein